MAICDSLFITLFRLTGYPLVDYYLGTFLLAFLTVLVGEFTISIVFKVNKAHLDRLNARAEKMTHLSEEAFRLGDEKSYKAVNKEGNDAFGQLFFNKFGLSAASLWPIFFALAWMQERFSEIDLPLPWIGWKINYVFFFLLCYILARIVFARLKRKLPYFKGVYAGLLAYEQREMERKGSPRETS